LNFHKIELIFRRTLEKPGTRRRRQKRPGTVPSSVKPPALPVFYLNRTAVIKQILGILRR
jgi:hypothetical protein